MSSTSTPGSEPDALLRYLRARLDRCYRALQNALERVDSAESELGADPAWHRDRFGVGLNGSIAGIVRHVGAWKHVGAVCLLGETVPDPEAAVPRGADWPALQRWLEDGQERLRAGVQRLTPADLERPVELAGERLTVQALLTILLEHDQYHAGQVNLLRQQHASDSA